MIWITSDQHFLSTSIIDKCGRPEDFNRVIVNNWNSVVSEEDTVLVVGDYMAGISNHHTGHKKIKIISSFLKGTRILLKGNHDYKSHEYYKNELWFSDVLQYLIIDDVFISHYPLLIYSEESQNIINKKKYLLSICKKEKCKYVIHGHTHAQNDDLPHHFNVCTDIHKFFPLDLEKVIAALKK